jgi:hypothetical protein
MSIPHAFSLFDSSRTEWHPPQNGATEMETTAAEIFSHSIDKNRRAEKRNKNIRINMMNRIRHARGEGKYYGHFSTFQRGVFVQMGAN